MNASLIEDIAKSVLPYAPTIASSLLGVPGGLIVSLLENLFGVTADKLPAAIPADPAAREKLQEFTLQHQEVLEQYALQKFQAEVDDRKSAREREEKFIQITGKRDWVESSIAVTVVAGFFVMCFLVALTKQDNSDHDILYMLIGQLTAGFIMVLSYFFGSVSSKQK